MNHSTFWTYILLTFTTQTVLRAVSEDGKSTGENLSSENVAESSSGIPVGTNKKRTWKKMPKGYHTKLQRSIRTAQKYVVEGTLTNYEEALEKAKTEYTEKKTVQKRLQRQRNRALGIVTKDTRRTDDIITTRVLKLVGHETDLDQIKHAKMVVQAEFRKQKRLAAARSALKKKAQVKAPKSSET